MKTALAVALASVVALGAGVAVAGPTPDDDTNDYEGRIEGNKSTYFGFDLSENGKRVNGITAYLRYKCENGDSGSLIVESEGGLRVKNREFSGKTTGDSELDLTYKTAGELRADGKARGTLKATGLFGANVPCKATNDGAWKAKRGRDIDVDTRATG